MKTKYNIINRRLLFRCRTNRPSSSSEAVGTTVESSDSSPASIASLPRLPSTSTRSGENSGLSSTGAAWSVFSNEAPMLLTKALWCTTCNSRNRRYNDVKVLICLSCNGFPALVCSDHLRLVYNENRIHWKWEPQDMHVDQAIHLYGINHTKKPSRIEMSTWNRFLLLNNLLHHYQ